MRLRARRDDGAATVEFVFLGVLVLVPLLYAVIAVFDVQRNAFAATRAAREAGRAFAISPDVPTGVDRARYAVRLALHDQGLDAGSATLRFVPTGERCQEQGPAAPDPGAATLEGGATFAVCVRVSFRIPGVPAFLDAAENTVTGRYIVRVDTFRASRDKPQQPGAPSG